MVASHYEILGVRATASAEDIRAAFRRRARDVHPDRHPGPDASSSGELVPPPPEQAMRELNEAWRVLGDPVRRRAYDQSLLAGRPVRPVWRRSTVDSDDQPYMHSPEDPGDFGVSLVRGLPWVAALAVLVGIFVFTAFAGGTDDDEVSVSASDLVGECVRSQRGGVVSRVACDEPNSGRVDLVAARASLCPEGSRSVRLPSRGSWLCLRDVSDP